ncbi:PIN domain-containing protein [Neobacillus sp. PS3-34]|uniref:PIN domain-containing protein n=1 Tax=Neobacillus sp. PS3-34 TaxID=3070678 RepID=UPI0027DF0C3B|nr:PIN domain-containing protein [Neobacillus sp. PS3-34]WML49171.1 PIN domain-containing protein [Neobacillus sp. PS3-34]
MDKHLILLDSNAIISANYRINSPLLTDFLKSGYNKMAFSEICLDESIRKFTQKQSEAMEAVVAALKELERRGVNVKFNIVEMEKIEDSLAKEIHDLKVIIIDKNRADLDFIYQKAMKLKKPFKNKNGKESGGVKDNLIWSSYLNFLKEVSNEYDKIIFVNGDTDYIVRDGNNAYLSEDLIEDLQEVGIDVEKFIVVLNLKQLNEQILQPLFPRIEEFNSNLENNVMELLESITESYQTEIEKLFETKISEIVGETSGVSINVIEPIGEIDILNGIQIGMDHSFVYYNQNYRVNFQYFIPKYEYYDVPGDRDITIVDDDWNDYVMAVEETWNMEIAIDVVFNINSDEEIEIIETHLFEDIDIEFS